jgi:hypothetical protein
MTNDKSRINDEAQMTKRELFGEVRHSAIPSSFEIRASSFQLARDIRRCAFHNRL